MAKRKKSDIELKNMADRIAKLFASAFQLQKIKERVGTYINEKYSEGLADAEIKFNMNFVPEQERLSFLRDFTENTLNFHTDTLGKDLRSELSLALIDNDSPEKMQKKVKEIFKDKKYANRLKTVLRTEGLRASNYASLDGALQTGLPLKKYLDVILDGVTSDVCKAEDVKYGKKEQAIPLEQEFTVRVRGETISKQAPPFLPNCRTVIRFVREGREVR